MIVFYNQIALPTNLNVQMDNASQLVGDVMAILNALIEVMKLIVVSSWLTYSILQGWANIFKNYVAIFVYNLNAECFLNVLFLVWHLCIFLNGG